MPSFPWDRIVLLLALYPGASLPEEGLYHQLPMTPSFPFRPSLPPVVWPSPCQGRRYWGEKTFHTYPFLWQAPWMKEGKWLYWKAP